MGIEFLINTHEWVIPIKNCGIFALDTRESCWEEVHTLALRATTQFWSKIMHTWSCPTLCRLLHKYWCKSTRSDATGTRSCNWDEPHTGVRRDVYWSEPERASHWSNGVPRNVYIYVRHSINKCHRVLIHWTASILQCIINSVNATMFK